MLSSENPPPDLSRSCKISLPKDSDEGASDNNPLQSFSIREYVFGRRGKDIGTNWPFSRRSLQLCLIYGVRDVLPPFDPARNPSSTAKCAADDLIVSRKVSSPKDIDLPLDTPNRSSPDKNLFPKKTKPCRLIVKSNNAVSHESETMASKVCPVCKAFSSSSNTTLNAHIDQCLSVGPCMKWHRIKARKTRLMVDIYETALRCTLEDLDTRNGTNWTSTPTNVCSLSSARNATDVYVDSNGTKVRMLSNLDDLTPSSNAIVDKLGLTKKKKYLLHGRGIYSPGPDCLGKSRTYGQKGSVPRPKICTKPMVKDGQDVQHDDPQLCKNLPKPHIIACDQTKSADAGVLIKQWARSKRTGLREKVNPEHLRKLINLSRFDGCQTDGNGKNSFARALSSRSRKFSSLKKNLLSVKNTWVQKRLNFNKQGPRRESEWKGGSRRDDLIEANEGRMGRAGSKPLLNQLMVVRNQKMKVGLENADESSKAFEMMPESISNGVENYNDPCSTNTHDVQIVDEFTRGYEMLHLYQDRFVTFTKSNQECVVPMFSTDEVGREIDSGETQRNFYVDVDSIPIPGPPGSFLPSPGRTTPEEEEHNVHSSLTTCKTYEGEHERVNMASSGSPISVVSNSLGPQKRLHDEKLDGNPIGFAPYPVFNYSAEGEYELATTPSTSHPILRLMGKNLMVVDKEKHGPWSGTVDNDSVTSDKIHTFRHIFPGGSPIVENMHMTTQEIARENCSSSGNGFEKVPNSFRPVQFSGRPNGNSSGFSLISKPVGSNMRVDPYHNVENIRTPMEIMETDGESEADNRGFKVIKATHGMANRLNSYQTQGYPLCAQSLFIQNEIKRVAYSEGMNENIPKRINCTAHSSQAVHPFSFSHGFS